MEHDELMVIEVRLMQDGGFKRADIVSFMESVDQDFDPPISTRVCLRDYADKLLQKSVVFIASYDNIIMGMASFYCNDTTHGFAYLGYLAVRKEARRMGIGKKLVSACIAYARKEQMRIMGTETAERNTGVIDFYQRLSFKVSGKSPRRPDGSNNVLFEYDLLS